MSDHTKTWSSLFEELAEQSHKRMAEQFANGESIFLAELSRELDAKREAWTPRQRRAHALRRPYYRARWWFEENVAWRFARERPYD